MIYSRHWYIKNNKEIALHLAGIFLRRFGHDTSFKEMARGVVSKDSRYDNWKGKCKTCNQVIYLIEMRAKNQCFNTENEFDILVVPQYKVVFGRTYKQYSKHEKSCFLEIMDSPKDPKILYNYPHSEEIFEVEDRKTSKLLFSIPLDSYEKCECSINSPHFYCKRLRNFL